MRFAGPASRITAHRGPSSFEINPPMTAPPTPPTPKTMAITMAVPWERSRYGVTEARTGAIIANLAELMTTLIAPMMAKSVGVGIDICSGDSTTTGKKSMPISTSAFGGLSA